jgi:tetratricopeptide (TPR) repeat protein
VPKIVLIIILLSLSGTSLALTSIPSRNGHANNDYIVALESLYNQGLYQKILDKVEDVLQNQKNIPDADLIQIYTYQAFAYVALDKKESAISAFRYLMIINPDLSLDPRYVSPKIIEVFEESRRRAGDTLRLKPSVLIPSEELLSNKNIRNQALKSLLYPGLGQLSQNKKTKGYVFLSTETFSLIGLIATHLLTNAAHKKYRDNTDIDKMDELYDDYSAWYRTRTGLVISSVSIWILNYIDATIFN